MANTKKKATAAEEPVNEELKQENVLAENEEVTTNEEPKEEETEQEVETVNVSHVEEAEEPVQNPAAEEEPAGDPPVEPEEDPVKADPEEDPVKADADTAVGLTSEGIEPEEVAEKFEEIKDAVSKIDTTAPEAEKVVAEELEKVKELEKELTKDIEKTEKAMPKDKRSFADKIFRRGFEDFWNGVTETI